MSANYPATDIRRRIERDLGDDAGREFHDLKEPGGGDRTMQELKDDAKTVYEQRGKTPPSWLK